MSSPCVVIKGRSKLSCEGGKVQDEICLLPLWLLLLKPEPYPPSAAGERGA